MPCVLCAVPCVLQLCAQQHRPFAAEPFHSSWAFVMCQDASFQDVGSEDLATTCLKVRLCINTSRVCNRP